MAKLTNSYKTKKMIGNALCYALLIVITIVWLFPFVGLVLESLRPYAEGAGGMVNYLIPKNFSFENYIAVLTETQFPKWYMNTLVIAVACAIIQTIVVLAVSYALSRMRFRGRKGLMNIILVLGMFPGFLTMICLYFLLKEMGLTQAGAIPGLILIGCASSGMGYYVCKGFFDTIPKSLDEAARIDGASRAQIFIQMTIPLAKPIIIYTALMGFMGPWCDYVFASYVAFGHSDSYNVAVALQRWATVADYQGYYTKFCAGGVMVAIPVTLLFMALQKYYVEGVTGGAVKG